MIDEPGDWVRRMHATSRRGVCLMIVLLTGWASAMDASSDTRLLEAAKRHDAAGVARLIHEGVAVNVSQGDGATALHWAAHWNDVAMAELLLGAGADPNAIEEGGVVPLALACENNSVDVVALLLKAGARPNVGRPTPVMTAARSGSAEVMRLLLASGGDAAAKEPERGQTALMWAAAEQHPKVVQLLLEHGADVHAHTVTPPPRKSMRPSAAGPNALTALLFAARVGDLESVRLLVAAGANVNDTAADGMSALTMAVVRGHTPVAVYLLEKGADPDADGAGYTALHWAAGSWETELTVTSVTTERDGEWASAAGLGEGRLELVEALLEHGANPNARLRRPPAKVGGSKNPGVPEFEGASPLILAASGGSADVMRALLAHGADPSLQPVVRSTVLMAAAGLGRVAGEVLGPERDALEATRFVLDAGLDDINAVDAIGNTALHYAAYLRRTSIVQLLVDRGARLDVRNVFGETPLWVSELILQFGGEGIFELSPSPTGDLLRKLGAETIERPYDIRSHYWPAVPLETFANR